jgi:hypothetical protein
MRLTSPTRPFVAPLILAGLLAACAPDGATAPSPLAGPRLATGPGTSQCTPGADHAQTGKGQVPNPVIVERCNATAGDLIDVRLDELLPTQPSLGYDEVYYKLGRYKFGKDAVNKRFDDWCEANGQTAAATAQPNATLHDPSTFTCVVPLGQETADSRSVMKTVVIGPRGQLYLTDGHHTFTSFWETPDGGPTLHVRARVEGNLSNLSTADFWREMQAHGWTWLRDATDQPINPQQLPKSLGLSQFGDDVYRGVLYFARDIGYVQLEENAIFQEFYWGRWLRYNPTPVLAPATYDLTQLTPYLALVKAISQAQSALAPNAIVSDGRMALELGALTPWNAGKAETGGEWAKLTKPYSDAKPGKIAYALKYKHEVAAVAP